MIDIYRSYSGGEFNRLTHGQIFYMFTAENIFYELKHIHKHVDAISQIRIVTIPSNANIYSYGGYYKSDKIILGEKVLINENNELCRQLVIGGHFQYIEHIKDIDDEIYDAIGEDYQYNSRQYEQLLLIPIQLPTKCYKNLIKNKPHVFSQLKKFHTEDLCLYAVSINPNLLRDCAIQTEEICKISVTRLPEQLQFVREQTESICITAVTSSYYGLIYVKEQTDKICEAAVQASWRALMFVKIQTEKMHKIALKQSQKALRLIKLNKFDPIYRVEENLQIIVCKS